MEILCRGKNSVHAFGYNSAESEPIWMKSGALWPHCWGLTLADFGRDTRSSPRGRHAVQFIFSRFTKMRALR